jgi:hypothetical protein
MLHLFRLHLGRFHVSKNWLSAIPVWTFSYENRSKGLAMYQGLAAATPTERFLVTNGALA